MQRITHIGVFSLAKIMGLSMLLVSAIVALIYGAIGMLMLVAGMAAAEGQAIGPFEIGVVVGMVVAMPVAYGILGFIMGAVYAVVLNLVFSLVGGMEVKIEVD